MLLFTLYTWQIKLSTVLLKYGNTQHIRIYTRRGEEDFYWQEQEQNQKKLYEQTQKEKL